MAISAPETIERVTTIIVCPTPAGGHIEHACDLALGTLEATGERAILLTRPGAADYLPQAINSRVDIREIIPPLIPSSNFPLGRMWKQFVNLIIEHRRIRSELNSVAGSKVLVLEEARYPLPRLLRGREGATQICLILHNVVEHTTAKTSLASKVKTLIARQARETVDYIAVHGERQRTMALSEVSVPVRSFPLPGASYVNHQTVGDSDYKQKYPGLGETFVCLGEIRANKGIEIAIEAAKRTRVPLLVIGKKIDEAYLAVLSEAVGSSANIQIRPEFVSAGDFEFLLSNCRALLLPYSQFNAQSGILARALNRQVNIVSSDLPSLREQAADYKNAYFFRSGSTSDLADLMNSISRFDVEIEQQRNSTHAGEEAESIAEWNYLAVAIQAGW